MTKETFLSRVDDFDAVLGAITTTVQTVKDGADSLRSEVHAVHEQITALGMTSPGLVAALNALHLRARTLPESVDALRQQVPATAATVPPVLEPAAPQSSQASQSAPRRS